MQQERYCLLFSLGCPVFEKQYLKYMHSNLPKTFQGNLAQYLREKRVDGLVEGSELRNSSTEDSLIPYLQAFAFLHRPDTYWTSSFSAVRPTFCCK